MRIYKPKHAIRESANVGLKEIPLSYVDAEDNEYRVDIALNPAVSQTSMVRIEPYQEFADAEPFLFDADGKIQMDIPLKRRNDKYVYEPHGMTEFTPQEFRCSVLVKRNMRFRNDKAYDVKVGIAEEGQDLSFARQLISIFGDANRRGICPANITVNGGSMIPQSLIANSIRENDFFIARSEDGMHITKNGRSALIDFDGLLSEHTNVWIAVQSFGDMLRVSDIKKSAPVHRLKSCNLYGSDAYVIDSEKCYEFDVSKRNDAFPEQEYTYEFLHPSVLILRKKNKGYIIVTPEALFDHLAQNVRLIYEILMNVYLRSYYESDEVSSWISDEPVDYVAGQARKINIRHKAIQIERMVEGAHAGDEYTLEAIMTDKENIRFSGMRQNKELLFFKAGLRSDPKKQDGEVSYYTSRHTIMHYAPQEIYIAERRAEISSAVMNHQIMVTLQPFYSSTCKIRFDKPRTFWLDGRTGTYCLCTRETSPQIQSVIRLIPQRQYSSENDGIIIATIRVRMEAKAKAYDIRVAGGGIPEDMEDDFDMSDIGQINGRPYRVGSTLIIRLPASLRDHEEKIMAELSKHAASGDYPVLIFD